MAKKPLHQLAYRAIRIEGGLLPAEELTRLTLLADPKATEQTEGQYRIAKGLKLRDEIARDFKIALTLWQDFQALRKRQDIQSHDVTVREWLLPLLRDVLHFHDAARCPAIQNAGHQYAIGHAGNGGRVPLVLTGFDQPLDTAAERFGETNPDTGKTRRRSPFMLAQEALNASDASLWAIVSNGLTLRILRDNASLTRPAYIEVDLEALFTEELLADFSAFWLLAHASRFGAAETPPSDCPWERWRAAGQQAGVTVRGKLRYQVAEALRALGTGFLSHPANGALRAALQSTQEGYDRQAFFEELLRLVYRLIFLATVEDRRDRGTGERLVFAPNASDEGKVRYLSGYSLTWLRERAVRRNQHDRHADLWQALSITFGALGTGEPALGLPALGGLFDADQCPHLDAAQLDNRHLMAAVFQLGWFRADGGLSRVNYRDMGPEELGSVYESLLELVPDLQGLAFLATARLAFVGDDERDASSTKGNTRKLTGSYYTPDSLVQELIKSALEPVIAQTVKTNPEQPVQALLALTVCDPACGSGHFLLSAARRLADEVALHRAAAEREGGAPTPSDYRHALRDVVGRCIFGVDKNPMAIQLAKTALWLEAYSPDRPLTFVDHHLRVGDALLGVLDPKVLEDGIPDEAYTALSGDDKAVASTLKKQNKADLKSWRQIAGGDLLTQAGLATQAVTVEALDDDTPEHLAAKRQAWADAQTQARRSPFARLTEALNIKLFDLAADLDVAKRRQVRVAEYVLADLLRAGAVETGFRDLEEYPEGVDIPGYREDLGGIARRVLTERPASPWYLRQQARLYLASIGDASLAATLETAPEVQAYAALQRTALFEPARGEELRNAIPLAIVAQQLQPNARRFGVWLSEGLRRTDDEGVRQAIVRTVALSRPDLLMTAMNGRRASNWRQFVPAALVQASKRPSSSRRHPAKLKGTQTLLQVISESNNLFDQENALLMLADALLRAPAAEDQLSAGWSAADIVLRCEDWSRLAELPEQPGFLRVESIEGHNEVNPLYASPPWVAPGKAWLYGLGRILRSALTGEFDFTSRRYLVTEEVGRYSGLRSTWFKRRFGLLNSGRGLLDEPGPVSPWLSSLLSTLLQWPGVEFRTSAASAAGDVRTAAEMLALVQERIAVQRGLFGPRSKTPMYVVPVDDHQPLQDRPLRVAIIQPMRPRRDEFDDKDPMHWTPGTLAEHRRHLAEVCRLTHQKLKTWASARPATASGAPDDPVVDVILFPELAVHPEHAFLLRRLSDKVRANIFTGLTFLHSHKAGGVVNQGLWLIRTESPGHGRAFQYAWQGKLHPMKDEVRMGVKGHRPHVTLVELPIGAKSRTRIAAAICYDATDLDLVADLRDRSDMFLVAALNQDVQTFDNMVAALHFHMYQPVILANSGEFGGSTAQVPMPKHERLIAHVHGNQQVAVSVFEVDPSLFKSTSAVKAPKVLKAPPAGYKGRPR